MRLWGFERVVALSVLLAASSPSLLAQDQSQLRPGARIRIRPATGHGHWIKGTFATLDAKQLTLQRRDETGPVVFERSEVKKLEVSAGRGRKKAAAIGALVGVTLSGAFTLLNALGDGDDWCSGSGCAAMFFVFGIPTAATGSLVGAAVAPERWRDVPLSPMTPLAAGRVGLTLTPTRGGLSAALSLRF
ncbi:MAG: hypothetical protein ACHP85_22890 [Burkholderiales bacterium]|jgi:hypothetical protein